MASTSQVSKPFGLKKLSRSIWACCACFLLLAGCGGGGSSGSGLALVLQVKGISPEDGTSAGGTKAVLIGAYFDSSPISVSFGGAKATNVVRYDDKTILCDTPSGPPGTQVNVVVSQGASSARLVDGFSYNPLPTLAGVVPANGTALGGMDITLTGTGFADLDAGANVVTFGSAEASSVVAVSDTEITCKTPAGTSGAVVDVMLSNENGSAALPGAFSYNPAPALTGVSPDHGRSSGGAGVTLVGTGFLNLGAGTNVVTFDSAAASNVLVVSDTEITCDAPAGPPSAWADVTVSNANGSAVLPAGFLYGAQVTSDLNNDGTADIMIGAPLNDTNGTSAGAVYVFFGDDSGALVDRGAGAADIKFVGLQASSEFGSSVTSGDVNGDGISDLLAGAPDNDVGGNDVGAVYVFFGPLSGPGTFSAATADVIITGESLPTDDRFGSCIVVGDVSGDGIGDVVAAAMMNNTAAVDAGAAYVFFGGPGLANTSAGLADVKITGEAVTDRLGASLEAGDLNDDGMEDLIIGSAYNNGSGADAGAVYVFYGGAGLSSGSAVSANVIILGQANGDQFGSSIAVGDVDDCGYPDLMVGAPYNDLWAANAGTVYLFSGVAGISSTNAASADVIITGENASDFFGRRMAAGDLDGDNVIDLLTGSNNVNAGTTDNGRCYVFLGYAGIKDTGGSFADAILTGAVVSNEYFGYSVSLGDVNGDGIYDILAGAVGNDGGGANTGAVHIFFGGSSLQSKPAGMDDVTLTGEAGSDQLGASVGDG